MVDPRASGRVGRGARGRGDHLAALSARRTRRDHPVATPARNAGLPRGRGPTRRSTGWMGRWAPSGGYGWRLCARRVRHGDARMAPPAHERAWPVRDTVWAVPWRRQPGGARVPAGWAARCHGAAGAGGRRASNGIRTPASTGRARSALATSHTRARNVPGGGLAATDEPPERLHALRRRDASAPGGVGAPTGDALSLPAGRCRLGWTCGARAARPTSTDCEARHVVPAHRRARRAGVLPALRHASRAIRGPTSPGGRGVGAGPGTSCAGR